MLPYAASTSSPLRLTTQNTSPGTQRLQDVDESKTEGEQYEDLEMPYIEAHYHPLLFATITLCAMAELGLTAFLINAGIETKSFPSDRYHALLGLYCFISSWTIIFGASYMLWYFDRASHFLANVASSVAWLLATGIVWVSSSPDSGGFGLVGVRTVLVGDGCNMLLDIRHSTGVQQRDLFQ
ncbi:hypothetical protein EST38_g2898 [Candolleomyces aberdarensis]|uniref:MARVEL domain-containing protein n=1 Tax=Candolleomyces aberdarensis TaxID=2316362 RepID=A0A4Q2DRV1_9AGAR|nr:hypothetical protein EST38_g2898 [Candolleomyces aberdarensis]